MTANQLAAQRVWQIAGTKAAQAKWSYSRPKISKTGGPSPSRGYAKAGRTSKIRGKAAYHHSGGLGNVKLAPWAEEALAGKTVTSSTKLFAPETIRGDITQAKGVPYRRKRKTYKMPNGHVPSFKGHQLTKKVKHG